MREPGAAVLYTQRISPRPGVHVVAENLALVERLGARAQHWRFPLPRTDEDDAYVERQLAALDTDSFIIVNPGGGWRSKCWSPEDYSSLIRQLEGVMPDRIVLTGSPSEEPMIDGILHSASTKRAGYLPMTLTQFIALARRARLFIGGDTGPLHLAAAVGTPIVGIYGPTDPVRNGPFAPADIALSNRGPINHTRRGANPVYLPGISVGSVVTAVLKRLEKIHG
jgi:ADP-heptose:LPS heptosyltransferase